MNNSWNVMLVVESAERLNGQDSYLDLMGMIRPGERLVQAFLGDLAPPGTSRLPVVISRYENGWQATGAVLKHATPVEVVELSRLNSRTPFRKSHLRALADCTVLLIGLGSVGSWIAELLARAGVASYVLTDPEQLEIENASRHIGTLLDIGRNKCDVVAEKLKAINLCVSTTSYAEDIFAWDDDDLRDRLHGVSCIVATTDRRSVQFMANALALQLGVPGVFAGCYDEARGGEVFCTLPGQSAPCYECLRGGLDTPVSTVTIDYSTARSAEDYTGEPGLYASIAQVTSVAAQVVLSLLLSNEVDSALGALIRPDRQFVLIGTGQAEGFYRFRRPFETFFQRLSGPRSSCVTCARPDLAKID